MLATQQIFLIAALLCLLTFVTLLSVASANVRGVREMLLAAVLGMVCNVLYAFGRDLPAVVAYEFANLTYAAASAALLAGYRQFGGRRSRHGQLAAAVSGVVALVALFHYVADSFIARSVVVSLFQAAVCLEIMRTVLASRISWPRPSFIQWFVLSMCALVATGHFSRVGWVLLAGHAQTSLLQPGAWSVAFLMGLALTLPALAGGGLLMAHRQIVVRAEHAGNHDFLTGASSRKAFFETTALHLARVARRSRPLALLLVDVDHFKAINDRWGHQAGDAALVRLVAGARATLRSGDCVARLGGDEFALLLPDADLDSATAAARRLQQAVRHDDTALAAGPTLTLSIGVTLITAGEDLASAMARADEALYAAKAAGRDRVHARSRPPLALVRTRA